MTSFIRKIIARHTHPQSQPTDDDADLTKFYTDSDYAREVFEQLVMSTHLPKRILVIHGIGGVGKSTLLKMYALSSRMHHIPAALVASEEALSPVDILARWVDDLNEDGISAPTFQKTLHHYRAIQAKVETESNRGHRTSTQVAGKMGITVAKTAITTLASVIPIVGPFVGALAGESAEAFMDWLRGFLTKPDMDLFLDPARQLNNDFLSDLGRVAAHQRLILMTDTYEQMTALDDWMRELARKLPKNILLVLAGRNVPAWDRSWQDWMGKAEIVELKEMTTEDIRTLIYRYYAFIRGGDPDQKQVEAIVEFARGMPIVATTVVQLWVKYGQEDFQTVKSQVVADLVDRLLEGVPTAMRPTFEAAAILRYFNVEMLSALVENNSAEAVYAELRRWPFIRSRKEGLAVHDTMREMINKALLVRTPQRFRMLNERAATYYEARLVGASGEDRERYTAERLYHRVRADEAKGITQFQEIAEEFARYRMVNRLRTLLNDVNNYPLEQENSKLWREYYNACLDQFEARFSQAEEKYQAIGENERAELKLRAYALCDWGGILRRRERLYQPGIAEKAARLLEASLNIGQSVDLKLAMNWLYLNDIYVARTNWDKAFYYLEQSRSFFTKRGDYSGILTSLDYERRIYARQGNLRKMFELESEMWKTYSDAGEPAYLRTRISPQLECIWAGHYAEAEKEFRLELEIIKGVQDQEYLSSRTRDLALCLSLQGRSAEALALAEEGLSLARGLGSAGEHGVYIALAIYGIACFMCGQLDRAEEYLTQAISVGQKIQADLDIAPLYLAAIYEVLKKLDQGVYYYQIAQKDMQEFAHNYYQCGALTGLVRIKYAQEDYAALPQLLTETEQLAQQYEYNNYLTSLYLTRGHLAWDGLIPAWESGYDAALHCYQQALVYALRYNRFLLDEALAGEPQKTPLQTIIPHCLERGEEGQKMLIALRDWWQTSTNDIGTPRPATVSLIQEGIPLLQAEQIARNHEPGDGVPQIDVVARINAALSKK